MDDNQVLNEIVYDINEDIDRLNVRRLLPFNLPPAAENYFDDQVMIDDELEFYEFITDLVCEMGKTHNLPLSSPPDKPFGMEVGDDRVDITQSSLCAATALVMQQEVLGMVTSEPDTAISTDTWNFCEVTSIIPHSRDQTFTWARKHGQFKNLGFIDVPPLRVIIDTTKMEKVHSTSVVGKASLLGSRIGPCRTELRGYMELSSFLQDGYLRTYRSPDPKYLPGIMGGSNSPALFREPRNLYLSVMAYHGGGYDRLYGTATQEVKDCLAQLDQGIPATPHLALSLRDRHDYLFGTYDNQVAIPTPRLKGFDIGIPNPLYEVSGTRNDISAVENRLVRAKILLPRTPALIELNRTRRFHSIIFSGTKVKYQEDLARWASQRARKVFASALQANTAFQRLLDRKSAGHDVPVLQNQGWLVINSGQREFTGGHADWLFQGGKGKLSSMEDLTRPEDMFLRDEVSMEESMKVGSIPLNVEYRQSVRRYTTTTRVGLYQINSSMLEWAHQRGEDLREAAIVKGRPLPRTEVSHIMSEDREWVNDDTLLIARCVIDTRDCDDTAQVALVTRDKRLANQMCQTCNVIVVMIDPISLPGSYPTRIWNSTSVITPNELFSRYPDLGRQRLRVPNQVYLDTGSVLATLGNVHKEQVGGREYFVSRTPISSGVTSDNRRYSEYRLDNLQAVDRLSIKVYDPRKLKRYGTKFKPVPFFPSPSDRYHWSSGSWSAGN